MRVCQCILGEQANGQASKWAYGDQSTHWCKNGTNQTFRRPSHLWIFICSFNSIIVFFVNDHFASNFVQFHFLKRSEKILSEPSELRLQKHQNKSEQNEKQWMMNKEHTTIKAVHRFNRIIRKVTTTTTITTTRTTKTQNTKRKSPETINNSLGIIVACINVSRQVT